MSIPTGFKIRNHNFVRASRLEYMFILGLTVILLSSCTAPAQNDLTQVSQWDRFEVSVTNSRHYEDPFRDVSLDVMYTAPDSSAVEFWGFYDGRDTWRLRFMPDQVGTWAYEAHFTDGSPGISGKFEVVPGDIQGMISRYEPNPIWFAFSGKHPVLVRSLHVGDRFFAENWDNPDSPEDGNPRTAFLDWAQEQGYNMLSIASHYLNRDDDERGRGWDTPALWPLDADEYRKMDVILDDLRQRGIMVFPFAGFFGRASNYPVDPDDQELYIRYTLARIGPSWNILFNVGGPEPGEGVGMHGELPLSESEVRQLGELISGLDVFNHLISVHNRPGDDPYRNSSMTSFVTLQGWKDRDWESIHAGMISNQPCNKPVYAHEVFWPGNTIGHGEFTEDEIRKKGYVLMMAAASINFADMEGHSTSGFSGTMDLEKKNQYRHDIIRQVWDFFDEIPFYKMNPRQDLVTNGFALAEEGKQYLVYLPHGGSLDVKVESGQEYEVLWINPRNTSDRQGEHVITDGKGLVSPAEESDWLLYLRAVNWVENPLPE